MNCGLKLHSSRTSLSKNQTSWEMKISISLQILHAVRHSGGMRKNALFKGCSTRCHGNNGCLLKAWGLIFIQNVAKNGEMLISLSQMKLRLQIGTSTIHSDINHLHFDTFNFPWERMRTHQKIIYLGTVLALFVVGKTGKRLSEFLQK